MDNDHYQRSRLTVKERFIANTALSYECNCADVDGNVQLKSTSILKCSFIVWFVKIQNKYCIYEKHHSDQ